MAEKAAVRFLLKSSDSTSSWSKRDRYSYLNSLKF